MTPSFTPAPTGSSGGTLATSALSLGINLNSVDYWTTALMFNDAMKYAPDNWWVVKNTALQTQVNGVTPPTLDQNGYPIGISTLKASGYAMTTAPFMHDGGYFPSGTYTLIFDGKGTVVVSQGGTQSTTVTQAGGTGTPHAVNNIVASDFGILISITDSDPTDYVRNIRLIMPGYQNTYQTNPFYQPFLNSLQSFSTLRFMDTMKTNAQPLTDWSQRTTATYRTQTKSSGVAVEYMVQLANTLHKDMWVNMPYLADDAYVQGFAQYVHDNLAPGLKVYVEYGNEDWNGAGAAFYPGFQYVDTWGQARGLTHQQATADLSTHVWNIWRNIFGSQTGVTFMRVAATQFSNPDLVNQEITRLTATADPTDPDHGFDIISGAPYFAPNTSQYSASTTVQQIESDTLASVYALGPAIDQFMAMAAKWGTTLGRTIPVIMYEGGPTFIASSTSSWYQAYVQTQTDPGMYAVTMAYLDILRQHGVNGLLYYDFINPISSFGPWGSMQYLGEPTAQTPKYNALSDYATGKSGLDSLTGFTIAGLAPATAGVTQTITVTARGTSGGTFTGYLGTVHFSSTDAKAGLPANYIFTAADKGVHTFTVTLKTAGSQNVTVSDAASPNTSGVPASIPITPGAAGAFRVAGFPATTAGASHTFTVTATDIYGNPTSNYVGTVHFTSSDWQGALPANYTFTLVDAGIHTFTATLKAAYPESITATDTAQSSMTGSQAGIVVSPAPFSTYALWPYPATATTGVSYSYSVRATDAYTNTITGYTGTVHFTSTDSQAALPANYTFTAGDQGNHTFNITLNTAGTRVVNVTDTTTATATTHISVQVVQAVAGSLKLGAVPVSWTAGAAQTFTVTALDTNGVLFAGYSGTVHFNSSDPQAGLPGNYTFTAADKGVHTFTVILKTAGSQSIVVTDTATATVTGKQSTIAVSAAGVAGSIAISASAMTTTAGASQAYTVTVRDPYGNIMTGFTDTVRFTSSDPQAVLPSKYTFTATDKGVHQFNATLKTAGTQNIAVASATTPTLTGVQSGITTTPAAANHLVLGYAGGANAGAPTLLTVAARDAYNNTVTNYAGTVQFSSSDPKLSLPTKYTFTTVDHGVHAFTIAFKTAGVQVVNVASTATPALTATPATITVKPGVFASFLLSLPTVATAGVPLPFTVSARDAYNNVVTGYTGPVQLTTSDPQTRVLPGYTFSAADQGVHTFNVVLKTAGTQAITLAGAPTTRALMTAQAKITVNPAAVATFAVVSIPTVTTAGSTVNLTVTARDAFGNIATGYAGTVRFTSSDRRAQLPPIYTFNTHDHGVHTFIAALVTAGSQAITVTDVVSTAIAASSIIKINPAAASAFQILDRSTTPPSNGTPYTIVVVARDIYGNIATGYTGTISFHSSDLLAILPSDYTFTAADGGIHNFTVIFRSPGTVSLSVVDTKNSHLSGTLAKTLLT
jgi:hypothetical protein